MVIEVYLDVHEHTTPVSMSWQLETERCCAPSVSPVYLSEEGLNLNPNIIYIFKLFCPETLKHI